MLNIVFAIIAGIISGMGMRRRSNPDFFVNNIFGGPTTCSSRCKFVIFYSNVYDIYYYKHKEEKY